MYGLSKAAGEAAVANYCPRHYVVRSCGLYGRVPSRAKGDNFITKIRRLAQERGEVTVVNDEIVTPTWTYSLARQTRRLLDDAAVPYGVVHASNEGQCSWLRVHRGDLQAHRHNLRFEACERCGVSTGHPPAPIFRARQPGAQGCGSRCHGELAGVARGVSRVDRALRHI